MGAKLIYGVDVLEGLKKIEDQSVNMCITSPPYWGLRDYGTSKWIGGSPDCKHIQNKKKTKKFGNDEFNKNRPSREETKTDGYYFKDECLKCGAKRSDNQLGLEDTPEEFVSKLVIVFREVRRVLRDDATLWVNMGDSYYNYRPGSTAQTKQSVAKHSGAVVEKSGKRGLKQDGIKEKDLVGIPWMLAFALRADGWYLRQDIIWSKPNPMPESVKDRCTKSHEYIFLLSKSPRYFYNSEAIKEPYEDEGYKKMMAGNKALAVPTGWDTGNGSHDKKNGRYPQNRKHEPTNVGKNDSKFFKTTYGDGHSGYKKANGELIGDGMRNKRSVWEIATQPYKEAHFATFPMEIPKLCIMAGCPDDGIVLDCFSGSATTGEVAIGCGRNYIGIDLNRDYLEMAKQRCGLFSEVI